MSTQPEPATPETEAGRKLMSLGLVENLQGNGNDLTLPTRIRDAILAIEVQATAAARAEPGTTPDDAHVRTPEGPDDYCTGCGELWPCSFQRGVAAARAEVARQVAAMPPYRDAMWGPFFGAVNRAAVLALLEDAAPRQPEPGEHEHSVFIHAHGGVEHSHVAPDTTTEAQQPPEVREPGR